MKTKHTQEKWEVSEHHPDIITCSNRNICQVFGWAGHGASKKPDNGSEESKANRRLIVRSPSMFKRLEGNVKFLTRCLDLSNSKIIKKEIQAEIDKTKLEIKSAL